MEACGTLLNTIHFRQIQQILRVRHCNTILRQITALFQKNEFDLQTILHSTRRLFPSYMLLKQELYTNHYAMDKIFFLPLTR